MAKVEALIAGHRYVLQSEADEDAMQEVIAEVKERIEIVNAAVMNLGAREQVILAFLDTVAELQAKRDVKPSESLEVAALISRLEYLEAILAYSETIAKWQEKSKNKKKRVAKKSSSSVQERIPDFAETQIALDV